MINSLRKSAAVSRQVNVARETSEHSTAQQTTMYGDNHFNLEEQSGTERRKNNKSAALDKYPPYERIKVSNSSLKRNILQKELLRR